MIVLKSGAPVQSSHGVSVEISPQGEKVIHPLTTKTLIAWLSQFPAVRFTSSVAAGEHDVIEVLDDAKS